MTSEEIGKQLRKCCTSNVFCVYDFIIWYCSDNKQLFEFYLGELFRINPIYKEFYITDNFSALPFRMFLRKFLQDFFFAVKATYSITDILYYYETGKEKKCDSDV